MERDRVIVQDKVKLILLIMSLIFKSPLGVGHPRDSKPLVDLRVTVYSSISLFLGAVG